MTTATDHWRFLPALDRLTLEPPRRGPLTVARIVMALVVLLLVWGVLGRLDVVVVTEGRLVPETYAKIVQPAEAGVLREILVREGDRVVAGQVLLRLDDTLNSADTTAITRSLAIRQLELRRLEAELAGAPFRTRADDDPALYRAARARYDANRAAWTDSIGSARANRERAAGEMIAAREDLARLQQLLPVYQAELAAVDSLRAQGYVSELDYNARRRAVIETTQGVQAQQARVDALAAAERQAVRELSTATTRYRADLERERVAVTAELAPLQQQAARQQHSNRALELRAPQAGIVKDLATHTPGTVVSPGTVLLTLVPQEERLFAEVQVRNEDIGHLRPGLPVQVKVHAYRFQKYGMLGGTLAQISPDAAAADDASAGGGPRPLPSYRARVAIRPVGDGPVDNQLLTAGMTVTAEVEVGTRSPLAYLLDPVRGTVASAGREI